MPLRVPVQSIGVSRDGKTVYPEIGKPFNFTADEVSEINELQKNNGGQLIFRKPTNEGTDDDTGTAGATSAPAKKSEPAKTMTVAQMKTLAAEKSVDLGEATKKDEIAAVLVAAGHSVDIEEDGEDEI